MLRAADRTLLILLNAALDRGGTLASEVSDAEWQSVYEQAVRQGVLGVAWDGLQRLGVESLPRELRVRWALNVSQIEARYEKQKAAIVELSQFYAELGIPTMVLKGYGLSLCYPTPSHRPCGDIDIWLFGHQREADAAMQTAWKIPVGTAKHHHTTFTCKGVPVENHYDFLNVHRHASNRDLERILRREASRPGEKIRLEAAGKTADIYLPPPDFNALFLLRHAAGHFAAEHIGLRDAIDWTMFVEKYHTQIDWARLERTAREMNLHRFLHCMQTLAVEQLGLPRETVPAYDSEPQLTARVLSDMLHPEFTETKPENSLVSGLWFRFRRWRANRWKHRIVYREPLASSFVRSLWSHLLKPRSLR